MPSKTTLQENVQASVELAKLMAQNINVAAQHPGGASEATVAEGARRAHEAIDAAEKDATTIVRVTREGE